MFGNLTGASILTLLYFSFAEGLAVSNRFTLPRDGFRIADNLVDREVVCSCIAACAATCNQENCLTVSFNASDGRCLHYYESTASTVLSEFYLEEESGWITLSKVEYTVFMAIYPNRTLLAYGDATNLCSEYSTVIATPEDMLDSDALGLLSCTCGWVSGETIQYLPSTPYCPSCDQTSAIVWCRL